MIGIDIHLVVMLQRGFIERVYAVLNTYYEYLREEVMAKPYIQDPRFVFGSFQFPTFKGKFISEPQSHLMIFLYCMSKKVHTNSENCKYNCTM